MKKNLIFFISSFLFIFPFCLTNVNENPIAIGAKADNSNVIYTRVVSNGGYLKDEDNNSIYTPNTYEAFLHASQKDYFAIGCDVFSTLDNKFICYNDSSIDINTPNNKDKNTGDWRAISSLNKNDLEKLNIGTLTAPQYICGFDSFVKICVNSGKHAFININSSIDENELEELLNYLYTNGIARNTTIISSNINSIYMVAEYERNKNYGLKIQLSAKESRISPTTGMVEISTNSSSWINVKDLINNRISLNIDSSYCNQEIIDSFHNFNLDVYAKEVDDINVANNLINLGIDGITSNELLSNPSFLNYYLPYVTNTSNNDNNWVIEDAWKAEKIYQDNVNSYLFQNLTEYGERVRSNDLVLLDGLSFTFAIDNFRGMSDSNYTNTGFYFSSWNERYIFETNNYASFSFFNNKYNASHRQDRFGIFDSEKQDDVINNNTKNHVVAYSDENLNSKGFGNSDGTLVLNHLPITALHFEFQKYNENIYKIAITEIYDNAIWPDTTNYDDGTTYVFVEASRFDLDANGRAYLFIYSVNKNNNFDFDKHVIDINQNANKVSFVTNTNVTLSDLYVRDGSKIISMPLIEVEGLDFAGWYLRSDFTKPFNYQEDIIDKDIVLFAKWNERKITVSFNVGEGKNISSQTIKYNSIATKPNDPIREGYRFVGWYIDEDFNKEYSFSKKLKEDITLYAKYEEIAGYNTPLIVAIIGSAILLLGGGFIVTYYLINSKKLFAARLKIMKARSEFKNRNK